LLSQWPALLAYFKKELEKENEKKGKHLGRKKATKRNATKRKANDESSDRSTAKKSKNGNPPAQTTTTTKPRNESSDRSTAKKSKNGNPPAQTTTTTKLRNESSDRSTAPPIKQFDFSRYLFESHSKHKTSNTGTVGVKPGIANKDPEASSCRSKHGHGKHSKAPADEEPKSRVERVCKALEEPSCKLYYLFLSENLSIFETANVLLQRDDPYLEANLGSLCQARINNKVQGCTL
jgi:hypothetical protein